MTRADDGPDHPETGPEGSADEAVDLAHRLLDLARAGDTERLAAYLDAGVPPDLTGPHGDTLIMLAAYHGHAGTVRALLARGADPDRANDRGQTPLAGAVFKREGDVVDALLGAGADPHAGTPSAAETAAFFGDEEAVARLSGPSMPPPRTP